jgi:putative ABC transport system permease protein
MEILKSISKEKLIVMVTHNPELAEAYSSRIIKVLDGQVIADSNPYSAAAASADQKNSGDSLVVSKSPLWITVVRMLSLFRLRMITSNT